MGAGRGINIHEILAGSKACRQTKSIPLKGRKTILGKNVKIICSKLNYISNLIFGWYNF